MFHAHSSLWKCSVSDHVGMMMMTIVGTSSVKSEVEFFRIVGEEALDIFQGSSCLSPV